MLGFELQLAHEQESKISRAYNGAQHLDYRRDMMDQWADFIRNAINNKINN